MEDRRHDYGGSSRHMQPDMRTHTQNEPGSAAMTRASDDAPTELPTTIGDLALQEYHATLGGRVWTILHTGAVLTRDDEQRLLFEREKRRLPYGVSLWPSSIALAHEIVARADEVRGRSVLELGAGTGLPGIIAASLGARVVETDRQQAALHLCRLNAERNGLASSIEHRLADWSTWTDAARYDWIIGSDILYAAAAHAHLRCIFESNLAPGGRILLADPFRRASLGLLEPLEAAGWTITLGKWSVGEDGAQHPVGIYELTRAGDGVIR
jgi:methyltransferase-like protein 23